MTKLTAVLGDLHGSLEEFEELLNKISYNPNQIRLVSVGDVLDRGPYSIACLRKIQEMNIEMVLGNHESTHMRYKKYELSGIKNNMRPFFGDKLKTNQDLSQKDLDFLCSLPRSISIGHNLYVVHAGLEPRFTFENQDPEQIIRIRYVSDDGKAKGLLKDYTQPPNTTYWANSWKGPQSVVFGHNVFNEPKIFNNKENTCIGVDTGSCFGGSLSCVLIDPSKDGYEFVSVKAKTQYSTGIFSAG